ncbi:hypothetical protein HP459_22990 [Enterobacter sp. CM29]|uniref:hypothetical protein n=1 Tax=Enterobacter sp. CM29 TaxID=2738449 RepID=UPI0015C5317D|nr:hypothetical protein [Enterobacter sp. CM29]NQD64241.1 hypothetical protein [Enterobacter sp. CM29]
MIEINLSEIDAEALFNFICKISPQDIISKYPSEADQAVLRIAIAALQDELESNLR